jgi:hypothetical protein
MFLHEHSPAAENELFREAEAMTEISHPFSD